MGPLTVGQGARALLIEELTADLDHALRSLEGLGPTIGVFGSARIAEGHRVFALAEACGRALSAAGYNVVTGAGPGLMEAVNRGAKHGPGCSIGLHAQRIREPSVGHHELHLSFRHLATRKIVFERISSAFVMLPGGYGTLDELSEFMMLMQTGRAASRPLILIERVFWHGLHTWIDRHLRAAGLIDNADLELWRFADSADELLSVLEDHSKQASSAPRRIAEA